MLSIRGTTTGWRVIIGCAGLLTVFGLSLFLFQLREQTPFDNLRETAHTWRADEWPVHSDYDIVVSWFNEDVDVLLNTIQQVVQRLPLLSSHRTIIYAKDLTEPTLEPRLLEAVQEVVVLPNIGREGETYLTHIIRHYKSPKRDLAKHTIFIQPHIAWDWVMLPRLENQLASSAGFMSLGPYLTETCGTDSSNNSFPRMADIYSAFRNDLCPPEPQLATWAGQFVVSRTRILQNPLLAYDNMRKIFHAPPAHWIWQEGWWDNSPSNPTFGHAIERMWPIIFNCTDPSLAEVCGEGSGKECVCWDD